MKGRTVLALLAVGFLGTVAFAQTATTTDSTRELELQAKIEERNVQIKKLETEINQYNIEANNANSQAQTLQNTLKTLDLTKKKITTDITLTEKKISKATLTIDQLGSEINKSEKQININKEAIMSAIRDTSSLEDTGLFQMFLSSKSMKDVWSEIDNSQQVQEIISKRSAELSSLKRDMENKQSSLNGQKKTLVNLKQDLSGKQQVVQQTAQEKAAILAQTKNKETAFKELVKTKEEQKAQFEDEVNDFEAQLNITIDKSGYPSASHGILAWPLDIQPAKSTCDQDKKTLISCIVQKFRRPKTLSANDKGHNGVDFRASTGTRVKSVLGGVVAGTGNTDLYRGCIGFGKWVMVNHDNGLSTIYMHLSVISVSQGQRLDTGDLIGYSGSTGSSQAPHLHVSLYATQGVEIQLFTSSIGCKQAVVPLADPKAYLDPLAYFPNI